MPEKNNPINQPKPESKMSNYGNSFGYKVTDVTGVERINVWDRTDEFFPGGGVLTKSSTNKEGDTIPAGTPVSVEKPGGAAIPSCVSAPARC